MYQENGWGIEFATLINISSYYEFQLDWERKLGKTIENVVKELNKEFVYDFENDRIMINFNKEEIDAIKSQYDDETLANMDHFSNLINSCIFERKYILEAKEFDRNINRWQSNMYDLKLRTMYAEKLEIAKPLYEDNTKIVSETITKKIKKISRKSSK